MFNLDLWDLKLRLVALDQQVWLILHIFFLWWSAVTILCINNSYDLKGNKLYYGIMWFYTMGMGFFLPAFLVIQAKYKMEIHFSDP